MTVTFNDLIIATGIVTGETDMAGGIVGPLTGFTDAEDSAKKIVNWAYADVLRRLPRRGTEQGVKTTTISWVADQQNYPLTGLNVQWIRDVEGGWDEDEGYRYRIDVIDRPDRIGNYDHGQGYRHTQKCWLDYSTDPIELNFTPIPTEAKTNNIKVWYWAAGAGLLTQTGSTILPFLEEYEELIALLAGERILALQQLALTPQQQEQKYRLMEDLEVNTGQFSRQGPKHTRYTGAQGF